VLPIHTHYGDGPGWGRFLLGVCSKVLVLGGLSLWPMVVRSQILPDQSLGAEASVVNLAAPNQVLITGGAQRSSLLFHSFRDLNVRQGETVLFAPGGSVETIFSRVTGGDASRIFGNLGVIGNANLFLLNPQGILFGPQSQLSLTGSFIATTADRFTFGNQSFSAIDPAAPPLLTVSLPIGLGFGVRPGLIVNQSIGETGFGLAVGPFKTLGLLGGDIVMDSGRLTAGSGRIELGSFRQGLVTLRSNPSGFAVEASPEVVQGAIDLRAGSFVTNVLLPGATVQNPDGILRVTGDRLSLASESVIQTRNASGLPGIDLEVNANSLDIGSGAKLFAQASGTGRSGNLTVKVRDRLTMDGGLSSNILKLSTIETFVEGASSGGRLNIQAGSLYLSNGGSIASYTVGAGDAGPIQIAVRGDFVASGPAINAPGIRAGVSIVSFGTGGGGDVEISSRNLLLDAGGVIEAFIVSDGKVGNLTVNVAEQTIVRGETPGYADLESKISVPTFGRERGGDLILNTQTLLLDKGGSVFTATVKPGRAIELFYAALNLKPLPLSGIFGNAGNVKVNAESILIQGVGSADATNVSQISSISLLGSRAGDVEVNTRQLKIRERGLLFSSSIVGIPEEIIEGTAQSGQGNGGNVIVRADDILLVGQSSGGGSLVNTLLGTQTLGLGNAGNTLIETNTLTVLNGASLSSGTVNAGNAGNLTINARDRILVQGKTIVGEPATIGSFAITQAPDIRTTFQLPPVPTGNTGNLMINTPTLILRDGGLIGVQHTGTGNAGTLSITAGAIVAVPRENSDIVASAIEGKGGSITIKAAGLFGIGFSNRLTPRSEITSKSISSTDGTVRIDRLAIDPVQGITELPIVPLESTEQIVTDCDRPGDSRFVISGRSGVPKDPRQALQNTMALQDWREGPEAIASEASGFRRDAQGQIELVAAKPNQRIKCGRGDS
jgi:filamentous hemagglutinin family protein